MGKTLIKNGTVITPTETIKTDLLIEGDKFAQLGSNLEVEGAEVIDAL